MYNMPNGCISVLLLPRSITLLMIPKSDAVFIGKSNKHIIESFSLDVKRIFVHRIEDYRHCNTVAVAMAKTF